jgi:uncharacterized protein YegP (UPF0339 family)
MSDRADNHEGMEERASIRRTSVRRGRDRRGDYLWRVVSDNGENISGSTEGYRDKRDRERSVKLTLKALIDDYGIEGMKELGWGPIDA